jgi:hypothetical protein
LKNPKKRVERPSTAANSLLTGAEQLTAIAAPPAETRPKSKRASPGDP